MTIGVQGHQEYQRAVFLLMAVGGALALVTGGRALAERGGNNALPSLVIVGALALVLQVRQMKRTPGKRLGAWLIALTCLAAGLLAATLSWPAFIGAFSSPWSPASPLTLLGQAAVGALFGLVSGVGLLGAHLVLVKGDDLQARLHAGRAALGPDERNLAERAVVAHQRLATGLSSDASSDARRLLHMARAMTLEVLALAARASGLAAELRAVDRAALAARVAELAAAAQATSDPAARADFSRASRSAAELERHLADLDAAGDRVRARLALQVAALESTAWALATRRASAVADQALALAPLVERLDDASAELRAEASALAELGAQGR